MHVQLVEDIQKWMDETANHRKHLCQILNEYLMGKVYIAVKSIYSTPFTSTGTNYNGRKCKLKTFLWNDRVSFIPTFQNMRTGEYTICANYAYGPDYFELLEEKDADVQS